MQLPGAGTYEYLKFLVDLRTKVSEFPVDKNIPLQPPMDVSSGSLMQLQHLAHSIISFRRRQQCNISVIKTTQFAFEWIKYVTTHDIFFEM